MVEWDQEKARDGFKTLALVIIAISTVVGALSLQRIQYNCSEIDSSLSSIQTELHNISSSIGDLREDTVGISSAINSLSNTIMLLRKYP
jgi:peptidoglycan hydrolase CwlO-like protein